MPNYGVIVVVELPTEEIYFLNVDSLTQNEIQKEYYDIIVDSLDDPNSCNVITINEEIAISSGGYNSMKNAIVEPPCQVKGSLLVQVE